MQIVAAPTISASPVRPLKAPVATPRVSVLIPTYNYARYLPEAIESVLSQDFPDYELVVVDDCSQDDSPAIIRDYAMRDPRLRYWINRPNRGMVANWNYCLSQARGEYVQFLFGDDKLADRGALRQMVELLDQHPQAAMAASARHIINERSESVEIFSHLGGSGLHRGRDVIVRCLELNANLIGEPSVVMLRRERATRGFNPLYRQLPDLEMWFHLLESGDLVYNHTPLYAFRRHSLQQTEANRVQRIGEREGLMLLAEYYARPWLRTHRHRRFLFTQVYNLAKQRGPAGTPTELEMTMRAALGPGGYRWFFFLHKLRRPYENFRRSWRKRFSGHKAWRPRIHGVPKGI